MLYTSLLLPFWLCHSATVTVLSKKSNEGEERGRAVHGEEGET